MSLHRLLTAAFAALMLSGGAVAAADLGGNCCADLEERVAELEATTARKGNRKVTLTVYGQVSKALVWVDGLGEKQKGVADNGTSPSSFGFTGLGKVSADVSIGYKLEVALQQDFFNAPNVDEGLALRHNFAFVESKAIGKVSIGFTSMATDRITRATTANTDLAAPMLSLGGANALLLGVDLPFNELRRNVLRYDSPAIAGFMISASLANGDNPLGIGFNPDKAWDIALRYANEIAGTFRFAAGIGYRDENHAMALPASVLIPLTRGTVVSGSASAMHIPSGIFINAAYGKTKDEVFSGSGLDLSGWHVQAGWEKRVMEWGATTIFAEHEQLKLSGPDVQPTMWGLGLNQRLDGANTDVYLSYRQYDLDLSGAPAPKVFMLGARIGF